MIKFKLSRSLWENMIQHLMPKIMEQAAYRFIKSGDTEKAYLSFALAEIGLKIAMASMKGKPEMKISFTYEQAERMIDYIEGMSQDHHLKINLLAMREQLNKELVNYKPKWQ
jgi:hypothetical protein